MPKQNIKELYKIGTFEFRKDYRIKISENTHSIGSETETIELLDPKDLEQIQREKFKILHIGAIQVAAKPLTRLGLDKPICICLRDARHNQFQDSLLGLMQANTSYGPVYFTCYPNLELDCMNDKSIHKALTLNIQTQNYDMDPRSRNILIVYKIYYKVMTSVVNPNCLLSSPKDQTLIWQANEKNSTVIIPKPIPWECLTQSSEWNFKQLLAPKPIEHPKLLSITEDGQGNVQINFEHRKENLTRTYSARSSNSFLEIRTPSRRSNAQSNLNLEEVDYSSTIPDLKYTKPEPNIQNSPNRSPTYSQMMSPNDESAQLNMMTAENIFEIDKEYLRNEAKSKEHVDKAKWFFLTLSNEIKEKFRKQWYQTMETMEMNIPMFTYFDIYAANNQIKYPFAKINMFQKEWKSNISSDKKIVSTHPPLEEIKIKAQGVEIVASPLKHISSNEDENRMTKLKDIKGIQQQNNFTNQILGAISTQLNRMESKYFTKNYKPEKEEKEIKNENPLFKPIKPLKLGGNKSNDELIKILTQKLTGMEIKDPSCSKNQVNFLSGSETSSIASEQLIENLQTSDQEEEQINKLKTWHKRSKNFYQRPTPPDLQFEERQPKQNSYNSGDIYSWNIDGLSEHEIFIVLRQMQMAATAYLQSDDDWNAVQLLLAGFNGSLKFWWDNYLTEKERFQVSKSINEEGEQDAVIRLVYAITKHFIGDPNTFGERTSEILQNLRCRTLSDFKWYHDVFIATLMIRADARASYWKERFLYGLPKAFNERVQESLREKHGGTIPFDSLTYGDLISTVKKEGLKLCSQLKLQYQFKKDLKASRKDLGSFCAKYGISMPTPPSQIIKKQKPYRETPFKTKNFIRKKDKPYKKFKKFNSQKSNEQKSNKKEVRCFKWGQKGHIAPNCKNKANVLSDKEEEYYSENTSSSETDKSQNDPEKEIEKIENCLCQINMLTTDQELLLEMIDQIEDRDAKAKYIRKVLEQQNSKPKPKIILSNAYQMKDLFQYYKKQEPATLQDLQEEVKQIKIQIEELKLFNQSMDTRITNLEHQKEVLTSETNEDLETFVHSMTIVQKQRWYTKVILKINPNYQGTFIALIDSGADLNCIQEGLIPTVYFVKTSQRLSTASNDPLKVQYKIPQGHICKKGICIKTSFLLVKNISHQIVLGTPFLTQLYPFQIDNQGLRTKYNDQEILFEFIKGIEVKEINQVQDFIYLVQQKQKQVKFL